MAKHRLKSAQDEVDLDLPAIPARGHRRTSTATRVMLGVLLDVSASMTSNGALEKAIGGFRRFWEELQLDEVLKLQLEVSLVGFADRSTEIKPYGTADGWDIDSALRDLPRGSSTRLGEAMLDQFAAHEAHVDSLRSQGLSVRGSVLVVLTDGCPNGSEDAYERACRKARRFEKPGERAIFGIGVAGADLGLLSRLTPEPMELASIGSFEHMWKWLLVSMRQVSSTRVGEGVDLPDHVLSPENPAGWAKPRVRF